MLPAMAQPAHRGRRIRRISPKVIFDGVGVMASPALALPSCHPPFSRVMETF